MQQEKLLMFQNRLTKVYRHLGKQARRLGISCYRLYDHDLPEFPLCIEFYGDKLSVAEYKRRHGMTEEEHDDWMESTIGVITTVVNISKENIFLKLRQRKPGRLGQYQKFDQVQHEFVVEENGLKFIVNLSDYLDTGLFLDHRITRQMVREQSAGKKVLNLFAYTGSFSVYAGAGSPGEAINETASSNAIAAAGLPAEAENENASSNAINAKAGHAAEVITVDLSKTYLGWAERNMQLNGFLDPARYPFIHADVKQYLPTVPADYFDLIVMDPPTFSNSKRMEDFLDIQQDHVVLINQCLRGLKKGGVLYFSTNSRKFVLNEQGIKAASVADITKATTPFDFEGRLFRWCFKIVK